MLVSFQVKAHASSSGCQFEHQLRRLNGEELSDAGVVEARHALFPQTKQPIHFDSQCFGESNKLEIENASNSGFNFGNSSTVNGNTQFRMTYEKFILRDCRLRLAARFLHAFPD